MEAPEEGMSRPPAPLSFTLTLRQRRLRLAANFILMTLGGMVALYVLHPFFRLRVAGPLSPELRKAIAVKALFILGYWTIALLLGTSLLVIAWLYVREIRVAERIARRDLWKDQLERSRERHARPPDEE